MIGRERRVRRAARQADFFAVLINDKFCLVVVFQNSPHVTDVMEQAGDNKMSIVGGFDALAHHPSPQNIPTDESDKDRMFEVMIKGVAPTEAFNGAASERAESLGNVLMPRTKYLAEVLANEITERLGNQRRDRLHRWSPIEDQLIRPADRRNPAAGNASPIW